MYVSAKVVDEVNKGRCDFYHPKCWEGASLVFVVVLLAASTLYCAPPKKTTTPAKPKSPSVSKPRPATPPKPAWQPNNSPFGVVLDMQSADPEDLPNALKGAARMGFKMLRTVVPWYEIEAKPGKYRFERYDRLVNLARPLGIDLMFTLAYCPDWAARFPDLPALQTPKDLQAWSNFVSAMVFHFQNNVRYWQIWEQPSIQHFRGTDQDYLALLSAAHTAAKKADPSAVVIAAEPGGPDLGFLAKLFQKPAVDSFEGIALYPQVEVPEQAKEYFDAIKNQLLPTPTKGRKLVFVSGWNLPGIDDLRPRAELESDMQASLRWKKGQRQLASLAVRACAVALTAGVDRIFWPQLLDSRPQGRPGPLIGLLDEEFKERPAGESLHTLIDFAPPTTSAQLYALGDTTARLVSFSGPNSQGQKAMLWSAGPKVSLTSSGVQGFRLGEQCRMQRALDGKEIDRGNGQDEPIEVGSEPILLTGIESAPSELKRASSWFPAATPREQVSLAFTNDIEEEGLYTLKYRTRNMAKLKVVTEGGVGAAQLIPLGENITPFLYCDVDDGYIFFNKNRVKVQLTVRASARDPQRDAGFNVMYDSPRGHVFSTWQVVEANKDWKDYTILLNDAYFANKAGFDFRVSALGSKQDIFISRITVTRV